MPRITLDVPQEELDKLRKSNVNRLSDAQIERLAILSEEMGEAQLFYAVRLLCQSGDVEKFAIEAQRDNKANSIKPYLHYREVV